jgi:alpha/beta superfamily hydrolase
VAEADVLKQVARSLRERGEATMRENTRCTQTETDTDVGQRELAALKTEVRSAAAHRQADAAKVHELEARLIASTAARETLEAMVAGTVSAADAVDERKRKLVSCVPWPFHALLISPEARKLLMQEHFVADIRHLPAVKLNGVIMRLLESKVVDDNKARTLGVRPLRLSDSPKLNDLIASQHKV